VSPDLKLDELDPSAGIQYFGEETGQFLMAPLSIQLAAK
jgi:hypothetical protein